jgi:hypothetical protein
MVLLRRIFFIDTDKTRYVSVGFYPARNFDVLVEFGGPKLRPMSSSTNMYAPWQNIFPNCVRKCSTTNSTGAKMVISDCLQRVVTALPG